MEDRGTEQRRVAMCRARSPPTPSPINSQTLPVAGKTYLFRVPYYGFYI